MLTYDLALTPIGYIRFIMLGIPIRHPLISNYKRRTTFAKDLALPKGSKPSFLRNYKSSKSRKDYDENPAVRGLKINQYTKNKNTLGIKSIEIGQINPIGHENSYRDIALLSDVTMHYFYHQYYARKHQYTSLSLWSGSI